MAFVKRGMQLTLSSAHEAYSHLHAMGVRKHTRHAATSTIALYHGSHLLVIKARKIEHAAAASAKLVGRCERRCRVAKDDKETKKKHVGAIKQPNRSRKRWSNATHSPLSCHFCATLYSNP